jgi:rod shape-determining protein MreC
VNPRLIKFKNKTLISFTASCLVLLAISFSIPRLRTPLLNIFKQPLRLLSFIKREFEGVVFYHRNYVGNVRLEREIDFLKNKLNAQQETVLENERLKNLLSLKQKSDLKAIASRVIGRSMDSWSSSLIIDKGKYHGIKSGLPVITYLGLVGRVVETAQFTSKILLINDPNLSVSAIIQRSRQEGLVSGTLGPYLIMKYLPEQADVKIQDTVVTSGLNSVYPKGLIIGNVVEIRNEFSGLSLYAIIRPSVKLSDIEEVLIVTSW